MTWLRHSVRHIHHTVSNHVAANLALLGWSDPDATPFGAPVIDLITSPIMDGDVLHAGVHAGTLACTVGDEFQPDLQELGGPLVEQSLPIFWDILQDKSAVALALAQDIRDILLGRIGGKRALQVIDQATGNPVPGWWIEIDDVERVAPEPRFTLDWQVVKATARVYFQEEVY